MSGLRLGVVGAGQLGRMLHQASIPLGVELRFLASSPDDSAVQVAPHYRIGSATDPAALAEFAKLHDVVTFEHEIVDLAALTELETDGHRFRPASAALAAVADKVAMRKAVDAAGVPAPPWVAATDLDGAIAAITRFGDAVAKPARGGYDGRGVFMVDATARVIVERLIATGPVLIEPHLRFVRELAVIVARRPGGAMVAYDPVVTTQHDGQCRQVVTTPGGDSTGEAMAIARHLADALDVVGLLAVELFDMGGELLVNELAIRPHNTGHHTIEAAATSQFENHIRAVLDLELGATDAISPAAMVNIIAADERPIDVTAGLSADRAAHVHVYGKRPRPGRKIGHVTVLDPDPHRAAERAWRVVAAMGADVPGEFRS